MFSPELRQTLNRHYQDQSITTMENQTKRLSKLLVGNVQTFSYELIQDPKTVEAALMKVDSLSSRAGICNTLVQILPHIWGDRQNEGLELLEIYQNMFRTSKTQHYMKTGAADLSLLPQGSPEMVEPVEIISRRWKRMLADKFAGGFSPVEIRAVALYSLLPPQIPSIYLRMRMVESNGNLDKLEKFLQIMRKNGLGMYDLSTGIMMIIHQRKVAYMVKFRVGAELRTVLSQTAVEGLGNGGWMFPPGTKISRIMRHLFPDSQLTPRLLRSAYQRDVLPKLSAKQAAKVKNWANFTASGKN